MSRPGLVRESGFTLVEVLVAILILAFVIAAASAMFVRGNDSSFAQERESQMISVADQQIQNIQEDVKTDGFAALALQSGPQSLPTSTIPNTSPFSTLKVDPDAFVVTSQTGCGGSNEGYDIEANYDNTGDGIGGLPENPSNTGISGVTSWSACGSGVEPLVILNSSQGFVKAQQTVSVGTDTAVVDTFVTDTYVGCNTSGSATCPTVSNGTLSTSTCSFPTTASPSTTLCSDARRVTVAVVLDDHGRLDVGPEGPVYVSTIFTNPTPTNEPTSSIGITLGLQLG